MPISELNRKNSRVGLVCGVKSLAPTMAMLVPPAYIAVTKSVGVSPLVARMDVPSSGCMIKAAPSVRPRAQTPTSSTRMTGLQKDRTAPCLEPRAFEYLYEELGLYDLPRR